MLVESIVKLLLGGDNISDMAKELSAHSGLYTGKAELLSELIELIATIGSEYCSKLQASRSMWTST
jgi:hypothetical protein